MSAIERQFAGLTAVLDSSGISIFWDAAKTQLQYRPLLGSAETTEGRRYRAVFLPFDVWSFGFTEADLNACGWATPIDIQTRLPYYGTR